MTDDAPPEARPDEVALELSWRERDGGLEGQLRARNVAAHPVRLSGKPAVMPLGVDGTALGAETVVTAELLLPGYVDLAPGKRAVAPVTWSGWDGPAAGNEVLVRWPGGEAVVAVTGPRQPGSTGPTTHLSTSWFTHER